MPLKKMTPVEIRRSGWEALKDKLGPASAMKFMLDFDQGEGDYSELRKKIFGHKKVHDIIQEIKEESSHNP
ncbi:MAG: hypothetical protein JW927_12080 [Deltaproteobacteria bacterium]|nr:hypothetical protein [Deltaproteobacteria bacterium]